MESMIYDTQWYPLTVPSSWKGHRNWEDHPTLSGYTGFAWYRCFIRVPAEWRDHPCRLYLGYVSECDETFVNRVRVGATGSFPPHCESGIPALRDYTVPPESLRFGTENLIAVRVYCSGREDSGGGLIGVQYGMSDFLYREYRFQPETSASPVSYDRGRWLGEPGRELTLSCARGALSLEGQWQVRRGDDPSWAQWPAESPSARDQVVAEYRRSLRQPAGEATEIISGRARPPEGPRTIWFRTPGRHWFEALPVGNGRLGAMVFGIPGRERLQLSEETVWAGRPAETDRSAAYAGFAATREHLFAERYAEAHRVYAEAFLAPNETRSFQTLGTLHLEVETAPSVTDYRRELDLSTAIARVQYRIDETTFTREVFASAVDDLIVVRLECDRGPAINARMWMERIDPTTDSPAVGTETLVEDGCLVQRGYAVHAPGQTDAWGKRPDLFPVDENRGVRFEVRAMPVVATNDAAAARVTAEGGRLRVEGAGAVMLLVAVGTDARGADPIAEAREALRRAVRKGYAAIREDHIKDYRRLFDRMQWHLGGPAQTEREPTAPAAAELPHATTDCARLATPPAAADELLAAARSGVLDLALVQLFVDYSRYLMISASRPGCFPLNNSGIWTRFLTAPWDSDFHLDMDLFMRYWGVEVCNLSECHEPVFDLIGRLRERGRRTAHELYRARGFTAHCITDGWFYTDAVGGLWYGPFFCSLAWLCSHLWEHYLFSEDRAFLRETAWPLLWEAAQFYLDVLVEEPRTGALVSGPSISPENFYITPFGRDETAVLGPPTSYEAVAPYVAQGKVGTLDMGTAMDRELIYDLFSNVLESAELLEIDDGVVAEVKSAVGRLARPQIGSDGRIMEWSRGFGELEPGHRHMGHLWDLYPGCRITPERTPEQAEAARRVVEQRWRHSRRLGQTAWSSVWNALLWCRLREPERAWANLVEMFRIGILPNLFSTEPPMVLNAVFGGCAAVAEMLLQSHNGVLHLLPALPAALDAGRVSGLRARGGFEVTIEWREGSLVAATITSVRGNRCRVRAAGSVTIHAGGRDGVVVGAGDTVAFVTEPGGRYVVVPAGDPVAGGPEAAGSAASTELSPSGQ